MQLPFDPRRRRLLASVAAVSAIFCAPTLGVATAHAPDTDATKTPDGKRSRLFLLGTAGGPTPKPSRAAPASAIVIDGHVYVIDCGNGVARQLVLAGVSLGAIGNIFVTHHHSDHNADYGNLALLAWAADLTRPIDAWGPPPLKKMTRTFARLNAYDIAVRTRDEGRMPFSRVLRPHELHESGVVMQDSQVQVTAARVAHPPVEPSFAYRFDCPDRSIVFSGDTRPTPALVELARDADILVHEVMYLPALDKLIASETQASRLRQHLLDSHTTTEQVGRIASEAGVKTLVLNHFVPGGDPTLTDAVWREAVAPYFQGEIVVGKDLMEL